MSESCTNCEYYRFDNNRQYHCILGDANCAVTHKNYKHWQTKEYKGVIENGILYLKSDDGKKPMTPKEIESIVEKLKKNEKMCPNRSYNGIYCPFALGEGSPLPCYGSYGQCEEWRGHLRILECNKIEKEEEKKNKPFRMLRPQEGI